MSKVKSGYQLLQGVGYHKAEMAENYTDCDILYPVSLMVPRWVPGEN